MILVKSNPFVIVIYYNELSQVNISKRYNL